MSIPPLRDLKKFRALSAADQVRFIAAHPDQEETLVGSLSSAKWRAFQDAQVELEEAPTRLWTRESGCLFVEKGRLVTAAAAAIPLLQEPGLFLLDTKDGTIPPYTRSSEWTLLPQADTGFHLQFVADPEMYLSFVADRLVLSKVPRLWYSDERLIA